MLLAGFGALVALAAPPPAAASAARVAIGAIQADKDSAVSRQLESALCARFDCTPRAEVVSRGRVDFAKMRERGVSGFLFGAVTAKGGASKLWLALLTTSERPARTWNLLLWSGARIARPTLEAFVASLEGELRQRGAEAVPGGPEAPAEGGTAGGAVAALGLQGGPFGFARIGLGAVKGDPKSQISGPLRTEICGRLKCVKRSLLMSHGRVDLEKMRAHEVDGFLFGSVVGKGRSRLWLGLVTTSEQPSNTWSLALTSTGTLPRASLQATAAEVVDLLAARAAAAQPSGLAPAPVVAPLASPAASQTAAPVVPVEGGAATAAAAGGVAAIASAAPAASAASALETVPAGGPIPEATETQGAPPAVTPPPAPPAAAKKDRTEGLIPGILIGPKVTATLLFPPGFMVGAELKVVGYVGASFEYGVFPRNTTVSDYSLGIQTWSAGLRAYPFRGSFFVGVVLGSYTLTGTQVVAGETATLTVKSTYLGPQIGWKWDFDFGLFLGLNLGYGFSLTYNSTLSGAVSDSLQTAKDNADRYLRPGVPVFTLLELGWLF